MASKNKTSRIVRRVIGGLFALGVVALIVLASLPKPVPVDTAEVASGPLEVTVDEDGHTRVQDRFLVDAPIGGRVGRPELRPGDPIVEGQVLARIAPLPPQLLDQRSRAQAEARVASARAAQRQARASVARAQAASEQAERDRDRQTRLSKSGGVAAATAERATFEARARTEELTSARFGVRVADYEVRMAQAALGRHGESGDEQMEVPAPIDGRVLRVLQESEGVVMAGTPLAEVGDPAALEIVVDVLTADAVRIKTGAPVRIERWGGDATLDGRVRRVEPSAFTKTSALGVEEQRVNVVIAIESPREEWEALGDGYRVEARIRVWRDEDVLQVPTSALFRTDDGWAVFVVEGDVAKRRSVEVGRQTGVDAAIESGLEAGDRVIVHPSDQIVDGIGVEVR